MRAWLPPLALQPPEVVERPRRPSETGNWAWLADVRGPCFAEIGIACWQIWHRCFYRGGQVDRHVKVLEVPVVGAKTRADALRVLAERMVGFAIARVEVYAADKFEPRAGSKSAEETSFGKESYDE